MKRKTTTELNIPDEFRALWDMWIFYKLKQHKFTYKDPYFEQLGFNKLIKLSGNNLEKATEIIENAIASGWVGFHPIKEEKKKATHEQARAVAEIFFGTKG